MSVCSGMHVSGCTGQKMASFLLDLESQAIVSHLTVTKEPNSSSSATSIQPYIKFLPDGSFTVLLLKSKSIRMCVEGALFITIYSPKSYENPCHRHIEIGSAPSTHSDLF